MQQPFSNISGQRRNGCLEGAVIDRKSQNNGFLQAKRGEQHTQGIVFRPFVSECNGRKIDYCCSCTMWWNAKTGKNKWWRPRSEQWALLTDAFRKKTWLKHLVKTRKRHCVLFGSIEQFSSLSWLSSSTSVKFMKFFLEVLLTTLFKP